MAAQFENTAVEAFTPRPSNEADIAVSDAGATDDQQLPAMQPIKLQPSLTSGHSSELRIREDGDQMRDSGG